MIPVAYSACEDLNHLFFHCSFSKVVWNAVLCCNGISREAGNWDYECGWAVGNMRGHGFKAKISCLTFAASVYCIWNERNRRIFQNKVQNWRGVLMRIEEIVQAATWKWRAKRSFENWLLCKEWGICDQYVLE